MNYRDNLKKGMTVYSSDGHKLGKVAALTESDFMIEKGLFFPKDYLVRYSDITDIRGDDVYLNLASTAFTGKEAAAKDAATTAKPMGTKEVERIPLAEEELIAQKTIQETGGVRVHKEVKTEVKEVSVPVMKEEVRVERVPATGKVSAEEGEFRESTTTIPIREEEVEIRKRPVVREEVVITKERTPEERRATAEVRKEYAEVDQLKKGGKYEEPK